MLTEKDGLQKSQGNVGHANDWCFTEVRDYQKGKKQTQAPKAGGQKSSSRKVREDDPFGSGKRLVLVYSLGDEMYKWANPGAIFHPFSKYLKENAEDQKLKYKFPTGWG